MFEIAITFIAGTGIGAIGVKVAQHYLEKSARKKNLQIAERKEAYSRFLDALLTTQSDSEIDEREVKLLYWASRVQLVCSVEVFEMLEEVRDSGKSTLSSRLSTEALIIRMRHDLGIAK